VLEQIRPHESLKLELHEQFAREGDMNGEIFDKLQLIDGLWKHFLIACDNAKD
jgi:hypothetical protein